MPHLLILEGPGQGKKVQLTKDRTTLGRVKTNDVVLTFPDPKLEKAISSHHAIIHRVESDYFLEDGDGEGKPSKNKTYLNNVELAHPGRARLQDQDRIQICNYLFMYCDQATEETSPPSSIDASISHDSDSVFAQTTEKLRLLLEISNQLSNTLELDQLLPQVVDNLLQHFKHADRVFLLEVDPLSGGFITRIHKTRRPGEEGSSSFSVSIVQHCLKTMAGVLSNKPKEQFPSSNSVIELALESVMCAPLWGQDRKPFGALLLDCQESRRKFSEDDLTFLMGVAGQASIALANARFHRDALATTAKLHELRTAGSIATSLLPERLPQISGYEFFACNESAMEVGGDYYDFIPLKDGRLGILVADVAGKGVPAALVMARFSAEARACLRTEGDLAMAVRVLNDLLTPWLNRTDKFVTLAAALLDPSTHAATIVNAGHPPPLVLRQATGRCEEAAPRSFVGPVIGVVDSYPYETHAIVLQPGDQLLLFSDGVTEAMDRQNKQFGEEGLRATLQRGPALPGALGARILKSVKDHAAGCPQHDDTTIVCVGRGG